MKILVLSDSHSALQYMRRCIDVLKPDAIIHLGDYVSDAETIAEIYPSIKMYRVMGNCDQYRCPEGTPEILIERIFGVDFYMTHGHKHGVKQTTSGLIAQARNCSVQAVLYGHTHIAACYQDDDLWVLNPGSSGYFGGSAGLICVENGKITSCRIIKELDLEEFG